MFNIGVNQGGNVSDLLFRKYLADLDEYLCKEVGVCKGDTIIAHLLWAEDLILVTDSIKGLQKQMASLIFVATILWCVQLTRNSFEKKYIFLFGNKIISA